MSGPDVIRRSPITVMRGITGLAVMISVNTGSATA